MARREFEDKRQGTVTFLVSLNVDEGTMWGGGWEANDHAHLLQAVGQRVRREPRARRRPLIREQGSSPSAYDAPAYCARPPRLRVFYPPPQARWLTQAEVRRRGFADKALVRFDPPSRQHGMDHLKASRHEDNPRFARPFDRSWTCRDR
jgi:hypothetical protein